MESLKLAGYRINKTPIYQGRYSLVLKAVPDDAPNNFVAIKLMPGRSSAEQQQRLKLEYQLAKSLDSEHIVKALACLPYEQSHALVFEYVPYLSLQTILTQEKKLKLADFLELAIAMTQALGFIHQHYIIHKDITPANILCDMQTKQIKIIDFGSAINLPKEQASINLQALEGTLAYISPEQSGRMNRGLDYRSDYYSLGVCFYQMLTGELPFKAIDALGLVYQHMAVKPKPPHELDSSIPETVSQIILKLMSKDAQDRYQNANGLLFDLKECLTQLQASNEIKPFVLGSHDLYSRFQIPEKLYGREKEIGALMQAYESAMQGSAGLVLIRGYSGVGKTSLVNEMHKPIVAQKGYFVVGKFEEFKRNLPFSGLSQAFEDWVEQVLTAPDKVLGQYKDSILKALGDKAQLIIELIPSLELILGPQPPVPEVEAANRQARLNYLFHQFLKALTVAEYPIVVFLDDLQWIDAASLNLLQGLIIEGEIRYLFFIGAYRSNEVDDTHPLMRLLKELDRKKIAYQSLELQPLSLSSVTEILSDTLHQSADAVFSLSQLCQEKTGGNPFFLEQLLFSLYHDDLIDFDADENCWVWQEDKIKEQNISTNVAELVLKKIKSLSEENQSLLYQAACIGASFDLRLLAALENKIPEATRECLMDLQRDGFIQAQGDARFTQLFHFNHDRIQEAAYSLCDESKQKATHLTIARLMFKESRPETLNEIIFNLLGHYNQILGSSLVDSLDKEEKRNLAQLNLRAVNIAKTSSAFEAALNFVKQALNCLGQDSWLQDYELTFDLHAQGAECAYLCNDYTLSQEYAAISLKQSQNRADYLRIAQIQVLSFTADGRSKAAIEVTLQALREEGFYLPKDPKNHHILWGLLKVKAALLHKKIPDLINQKEMNDPAKEALVRLLFATVTASFIYNSKLAVLFVFTEVLIGLKHGLSRGQARAFLFLAALYYNMGNIRQGEQLRVLSWQLKDKYQEDEALMEMVDHDAGFIDHLASSLQEAAVNLQVATEHSLASGDALHMLFAATCYVGYAVMAGFSLSELQEKVKTYQKLSKKHRIPMVEAMLFIEQQWIYSLIEVSRDPEIFNGPYYQEQGKEEQYLQENLIISLTILYLAKWHLARAFERWPEALKLAACFKTYEEGAALSYWIPYSDYAKGLTCINNYGGLSFKNRIKLRFQALLALKKVRYWAKICPVNHLHKYYLLQAEYASIISQNPQKAQKFYNLAIEQAQKARFINEEAEANRAAARHHLRYNNPFIALGYIKKAHALFSLWGADAVAADIEKRYLALFQLEKEEHKKTGHIETQVTLDVSASTTLTENMDLKTVLKSSAALSGSLLLSDLLQQLSKIVIENVGAQKFLLLLEKKSNYFIEAEQESGQAQATLLQGLIPSEDKLPLSILQFILRSKKAVLLNLALSDERYSQDPYIQKHQIKSILCLPLLKKMELYGVLYLENKDTEAAFTKERFDILKLLLAQISISIDNARLYSNTLALNKAYEQFVPYQFLTILSRESILDVVLGDHAEKVMSILFLDIRDFTTLSEGMSPEENFDFINRFLSVMAPVIRKNYGVIDKYIGDAIMAIFPESSDDALNCAVELLQTLDLFNQAEEKEGHKAVKIGVGINTGQVMVGMLGESNRMNATVISDAVNTAARVESLSKEYKTPIIITQNALDQLNHPEHFKFKKLGQVYVKGKTKEPHHLGLRVRARVFTIIHFSISLSRFEIAQ